MPRHSRLLSAALPIVVALLAAACNGKSPTPPTTVCSISIAPPTNTVGGAETTGTIAVTTSAAGCEWAAVASAPWVTITAGATGTGAGTVQYRVAENPSPDVRTAAIGIEDQLHTIVQQGLSAPPPECTYTLDPPAASAPPDGHTATFSVQTADRCAWSAQPAAPWLSIVSGAEGQGAGVVTYRVGEHDGGDARTGSIVVADQTFVVTQVGEVLPACIYTVSVVHFAPCMPAGIVETRLDTLAHCPWTVESTVPWLAVTTPSSGTGSVTVSAQHTANYDAPRSGILMLRWPTATAGQNVLVEQAGCTYATSVDTVAVPATGGTASFDVLQQSIPVSCGGPLQDRCQWRATTTAPWITITTTGDRVGDNPVAFTVAANTSTEPRSATIVVRDRVVTVTQAGVP